MSKIHTTLHPQNDESVDLYPNIESENIPTGAVTQEKIANGSVNENKLDTSLKNKINGKADANNVYDKEHSYSKTQVNSLLDEKVDKTDMLDYDKETDTLTVENILYGENEINLETKIDDLEDEIEGKAPQSTTYTKSEVDGLLNGKANQSTTYTKTEVDDLLSGKQNTLTFDNQPTPNSNNPVKSNGVYNALSYKVDKTVYDTAVEQINGDIQDLDEVKANKSTTYTKTETDTLLNGKQATLVSGSNIKTINNESLLGGGNINIKYYNHKVKLFNDGGDSESYIISFISSDVTELDSNTWYNTLSNGRIYNGIIETSQYHVGLCAIYTNLVYICDKMNGTITVDTWGLGDFSFVEDIVTPL